ncbi:gastric triacylglycerol lipase-like [Dermacentor andersoni]|uniref:gastric triacylglycerol lipase-like n=1 Tax=Dermacentor andersoni TaxID=34620 RepID=UPI003B3B4A56
MSQRNSHPTVSKAINATETQDMHKIILPSLLSIWFACASLGHSNTFNPRVIKNDEKNVSQLIADFGYPVQEYTVTTEDLYDIMIQRIPHGRVPEPGQRAGKPVAFLMTGVLSSSADFVVNMPDQSLGFILADHGFDVWLGNVRGNSYSKHRILKRWQPKFWDFSFDEMIQYDLPAQIDAILAVTKMNSLLYVGWSQGTIIMFGLLATKPDYNQKVRLFNAMAPAALVGHVKSNVRHVVPFGAFIKGAFQAALNGPFLARDTKIGKKLWKEICASYGQGLTCKSIFKFFNGAFPVEMNMTRFPVYMANNPAGSSVRNMFHIAQIMKANRFQKFDWGLLKNKIKYGQAKPPQYDLSKVTAPVALYWSEGDALVRPEDVTHLKMLLPNVVLSYKVAVPGFTHVDFAWSINAKNHLYKAILYMMMTAQMQPPIPPSSNA